MATYLTIDKMGMTVSNLTAMPVEIQSWLRLSVRDYVDISSDGGRPDFTMQEAGVILTVTSTLRKDTPQYLVKIEILGHDLEVITRLHLAALEKIREIAEKKPAPKKWRIG